MNHVIIRPITSGDDAAIAAIIRENLGAHHLDIPGAAYFDPELDCLSGYYHAMPGKREYCLRSRNKQICRKGWQWQSAFQSA